MGQFGRHQFKEDETGCRPGHQKTHRRRRPGLPQASHRRPQKQHRRPRHDRRQGQVVARPSAMGFDPAGQFRNQVAAHRLGQKGAVTDDRNRDIPRQRDHRRQDHRRPIQQRPQPGPAALDQAEGDNRGGDHHGRQRPLDQNAGAQRRPKQPYRRLWRRFGSRHKSVKPAAR